MFKGLLFFAILLAVIILSECAKGCSDTPPCTGVCTGVDGKEKDCEYNENGLCHCPANNNKPKPGECKKTIGGTEGVCADYKCTNEDGVPNVICKEPALKQHPLFSLTRGDETCECPLTCSNNNADACSTDAICPQNKMCDRGVRGDKCACRGTLYTPCDPCKKDGLQCIEEAVCRPSLVEGQSIFQHLCVPRSMGDPCNYYSTNPNSCGGPLICAKIEPAPPTGAPTGVCSRPPQPLNSPCSTRLNNCLPGFTCIPSSTAPVGPREGICKKDPGETCNPATASECSSGQCNTGGFCDPIGPNDVCNLKKPTQCQPPYTCQDPDGDGQGKCL